MKNRNLLLRARILFLFTLLCAAVASPQTIHATTRYVSTSGDNTDNDCTGSANACATIVYAISQSIPGDTVEVAAGTYTEHGITVDKDLTISGHSASDTIVQAAATPGTATDRVFFINPGKTVTISGLTITNGSAFSAGGIFNDHATLTVTNSTLSGNLAPGFRFLGGFGGGIYNDGSSGSAALTVNNSTLSGNSAVTGGGGIVNDSSSSGNATLTVTNSTLSGNSASSGFGGGIYNDGFDGNATLTLTNSTLSGNSAGGDGGGGIYNNGESDGAPSNATLTVTNSTLSANSASNGGGGGILNDGSGGSATSTVSNSTLSGNSASVGGGIDNYGAVGSATLTLFNSTLSGNSASSVGGGIVNDSGRANGSATLTIGDTILNAAALGGANIVGNGTVTSNGYNLSSDAAGGDPGTTVPDGFLNATGDIRNTDPMLDTNGLQDNGGPTLTIAVLTGSPAIDQGYNFSGSTTDQRGTGFARTVDLGFPKPMGGDGTDIGAFEVQSSAPCPQPQGYRKNNPDAWPVNMLTLGNQSYTESQLLIILKTPVGTGPKADASLILADQLIAAKLNVANGADEPDPVPATISDADGLLSGFSGMLPYHVKPSTTTGQQMVNDAATLESFNKGMLTPGCSP